MCHRIVILFFLLWISVQENASGQNSNVCNVWAFGNRAGADFNTTPPSSFVSAIDVLEGSASVCDEKGRLLFYSDGTTIWNKNNEVMPNGNNINPIPNFLWNGKSVSSTFSTTQGVVIVPRPTFRDQYYVFSLTAWDCWEDGGKLYYSLVDMSLNGGLGDVVPNKKGVLLDSQLTERMTAVLGDRCNVWLSVVDQSLHFRSYEIDVSGISRTPVISPTLNANLGMAGGSLVFSPKGDMLALLYYTGTPKSALYQFDIVSGKVSNPVELFPGMSNYCYGACFSPDNSKLYVNVQEDSIYQYDVSLSIAADIVASRKTVGKFRGGHTAFKRAPDGKIYFMGNGSRLTPALSAIPRPNLTAPACGLEVDVLPLAYGTSPVIGLPNDVPDVNKPARISSQHFSVACTVSDALEIKAVDTTGWDYKWNGGSSGFAQKTNGPGVYFVTYYTDPCLFHVDTFQVTSFFPPEAVPTIRVIPNCSNTTNKGSITLVPNAQSLFSPQYTWFNERGDTLSTVDSLVNIVAGNYLLTVTLGPHCDTTISIEMPQLAGNLNFHADTLICQGQSLVLENISTGNFTSYHWDFGDQTIDSGTQVPIHHYKEPGNYYLKIIGDEQVCRDTFYRLIVVDPRIESKYKIDRDTICTGEQILFSSVLDATMINKKWEWGDGNSTQLLNEDLIGHAFGSEGAFAINLTTSFRVCPSVSYERMIYVSALPIVDLASDTSLCIQGDPIRVANRHPAEEGETYLWNTGATTDTLDVVQPGLYTLKVTNKNQCATTEQIEVAKGCFIDIPNAFSPNGDGYNDYFFPRQLLSDRVLTFNMQVYNRWGQLLFETQKLDGRGWDGKFNTHSQDIGVYIYLIKVTFKNGRSEQYEGHVTLVK